MKKWDLGLGLGLAFMIFSFSQALEGLAYYGVRDLAIGIIAFGVLRGLVYWGRRPGLVLAGLMVFMVIISWPFPQVYFYLPLLAYPFFLEKTWGQAWLVFSLILGLVLGWDFNLVLGLALLVLLSGLGYRMVHRGEDLIQALGRDLDDYRLGQRASRQDLDQALALQKSRIQASRLEERRKITGELHDLLGHQLSAALIQLAALEMTTQDEGTREGLVAVHQVLEESMEGVRAVIHQSQDEASDLRADLEALCDKFSFCPVFLAYDLKEGPPSSVAHVISLAVREGLTNIAKHSNASRAHIRLADLPGMWTLLIKDNGQVDPGPPPSPGIGLINMERRVQALGGQMSTSREEGFRVFFRIPKPQKGEYSRENSPD